MNSVLYFVDDRFELYAMGIYLVGRINIGLPWW